MLTSFWQLCLGMCMALHAGSTCSLMEAPHSVGCRLRLACQPLTGMSSNDLAHFVSPQVQLVINTSIGEQAG